jgi:putative PIN family toxin of toxin-antitoxin system
MTPRVVFDSVVFLQAAGRPSGPAAACLVLLSEGRLTLCLCSQVFAEVADILNRPRVRRRFPLLTDERVDRFLLDVRAKATFIDAVPPAFTDARDPDDEPLVNLAVAAGARYLVTWDNDLLDLMGETTPAGSDFRQRFPGLTVLNPVALLRAMAPGEG